MLFPAGESLLKEMVRREELKAEERGQRKLVKTCIHQVHTHHKYLFYPVKSKLNEMVRSISLKFIKCPFDLQALNVAYNSHV